jgi:hypothetical protein
MIASRRGLWSLAAIAAVLAIWVVADLASSTAPVGRALIPGFDPAHTKQLAWPDITATRTPTGWSAGAVLLDADAVGDVLRTLEAARWHRREPASMAGAIRRTLAIDGARIGIATPLAGTDQVWLVRDGDALLVDGWVARALDRTPLDLRVRHPLAMAARAEQLAISTGAHTVVLRGTPRRYENGDIASAPDVHAIEQQLADLEVGAIPAAVTGAKTGEVHADAVALKVHAACAGHPDLVEVTGTYGDGCIRADAWRALARAVDDRLGEHRAIDPRPVPVDPTTATLADGTVITFGPPPRAGDRDADADRVGELRAALTAPAALATSPATPAATIAVVDRAGAHWDVELLPGGLVRRVADHAVLRPAHADVLARPGTAYLDPTRWSEDRFAVSEIALDGVTYARGAVVGEWTRTPPGALAPDKLEALAAALATVRAPVVEHAGKPVHHVTVKLAPPVGAPATHELAISASCDGAVDGQPVAFDPALCAAVRAVAR